MQTSKRLGEVFSHKLRGQVCVGIAFVCWLAAILLGTVFQRPFLALENKLLDARMLLPHRVEPSKHIVFIDIDDRTIEMFGRWPWTRAKTAQVIQRLNQGNIWGIFVDLAFFEETSPRDDLALIRSFENSKNCFIGMGAELVEPGSEPPISDPKNGILNAFRYNINVSGDARPFRAVRTLSPLPSLMAVVTGLGHITFVPDEDGVARHLPLFFDLEGKYFPSIDIEIARTILDVVREDIEILPGKYVTLKEAKPPGQNERIDISIPVDKQLRMVINHAGKWAESFVHYPLHTILWNLTSGNDAERREAEDLLSNNLIILSVSFSGAADMGATPLEPLVPRSEIHGHVISSIVNQKFLKRVPASATMSIALLFCLLIGVLSPRLRTLHFSAVSTFMISLWILCALFLFSLSGLIVEIVLPGMAILLSYGGCAGYMHLKAESERAWLRKAFSHYVSPDVLSQMLENPARLKLGGERIELSLLVLVLEKFERFSENAEPEEIIDLLTSVYERACDAILKHGGTIDKFTKDGLIAFFGAPLELQNHPQAAAQAALAVKRELAELTLSRGRHGQRMVGIRMAINTAFVTVGNIGSSQRMDYTVIGRNVNLCVHLARQAAEGQIVVTRKTYEQLEATFKAEECGEIRFEPYPKPFFIFNLIGLKESLEPVPPYRERPADDMARKKFLGPYVLNEKLGAGNTGTVYRGYDESLDRQVAIKILFPGLRKDRIRIVMDEAKTLARLSHPNIVQVYYAGEEDDIGFLAMEFVDGVNLRELLNMEGSLSTDDTLDIIIQVCRGLNAANKEGIIHRDIKPANLLMNQHGIIKIADFGLAAVDIHQKDQSRRVAGTFQYTSPEQAQGLKVDCRSDIYSLGITFFHLLVGEPPFHGGNVAGLIWQHAEAELPTEPLRAKGIPDPVVKMICKMTAKLPGDRYPGYMELLTALDRVESEVSA